MALLTEDCKTAVQQLDACFTMFDTEKSGTLDREEFEAMINASVRRSGAGWAQGVSVGAWRGLERWRAGMSGLGWQGGVVDMVDMDGRGWRAGEEDSWE